MAIFVSKANITSIVSKLKNLIAKKQDALTSDQLTVVNSGLKGIDTVISSQTSENVPTTKAAFAATESLYQRKLTTGDGITIDDCKIYVNDTTHVLKAGDTVTGTLKFTETAGNNPIITRGITGRNYDGSDTDTELYLNYNGGPVIFGKNGGYRISSDGSTYSGSAAKVNGHTVLSDVPSNAKFTDTTYALASSSTDGLMSASDKKRLDNLADLDASNYYTKSEVDSILEGIENAKY